MATWTPSTVSSTPGVESATDTAASCSSSTTSCADSSSSNATFLGGSGRPTTFQTSTIASISGQAINSSVIIVGSTSENSATTVTSSSTTIAPLPTPDRDHWHTPPVGPTNIGVVARDMSHNDETSGWRQYVQDLLPRDNDRKKRINEFDGEREV
ncbi:hypothetical protein F5Y11DRAFT_309094 [Daldinia sp. FL1419]|nr:hypothetical protein F5Y11DRAFT_309094 [Daldinia sp. FL1419]